MKLAIAMLLLAGTLHAQELPFKPKPVVRVELTNGVDKWWQPLPVPHRTADRAYWASTITSLGWTVADVENSVYILKSPKTHEVNFIFGSHPSRGRYYAICLPVFLGSAYLSYRYKREDEALKYAGLPTHKYVRWWLPEALNTGSHVLGVLVTLTSTGR